MLCWMVSTSDTTVGLADMSGKKLNRNGAFSPVTFCGGASTHVP